MRSHSGIETPIARTAKPVGSLRPGQSDKERLNAQSFSSNLAFSRTLESDDAVKSKGLPDVPAGSFSVSTIISNLMAAISMSLVLSLASRQDLTPIGSCSCIGNLFPQDLTSRRNEIWPHRSQLGMSLSSIHVRWSSSGTLTVLIFQTVIPWLQRVSEIPVDAPQSSNLPHTRKVLISPSGMVGQYSRELEMQTACQDSAPTASYHQPDHVVEVKKSIVSYLALQGIHVTLEEKWLQLQHINPTANRIDEVSRQHLPAGSFPWPAKLCFYQVESLARGETLNSNKIYEDTQHDPLVYAESWFKEKAKREEALETKRKEDERSAQRLQEAQEVDVGENLSDVVPRTQYLSTQDAGGIYPTPPDGLRSLGVGPAVNTDTQALAGEFVEKEISIKVEGNGILAGSPFADAMDPDVTSARYDEPDDGDLFGDMNSSLFAANGLTEADFSFFDEPRIDGELDLPLDLERKSAEVASREVQVSSLLSDRDISNEGLVEETSGVSIMGDGLTSKKSKAKTGIKFLTYLSFKYPSSRSRLTAFANI